MSTTPGRPPPRTADRVETAFRAHPRARFLPKDQRAHAHEDRPLPIGHGQTSSQPSTVAAMLRLLDVPQGSRVLDVGAGSGWTTALLGHLVGPTGSVLGVELEPALAAWGAANQPADQEWARVRTADRDELGAPAQAPFDRILVSAQARHLPTALADQLTPGGRMVIPVAGEMLLVVRDRAEVTVTRHGGYRFVPLR